MEKIVVDILETLLIAGVQSVLMYFLGKYLKFSTSGLLNKCRKIYSTYSCKVAVFVILFTLSSYTIHKIVDKEFINILKSYSSLTKFEIWILGILCSAFILAVFTDIILMWRRREFARTLASKDYRIWLIDTLKGIYPGWRPVCDDENHAGIGNTMEYASAVFDIKDNLKWAQSGMDEVDSDGNVLLRYTDATLRYQSDFLSSSDRNYISKWKFLWSYNFFDLSLGIKALLYRFGYYLMVRNNIRFPNLIGYALDDFEYDGTSPSDMRIDRINCSLTTYFHCVMTCHIMEYELYRAYKRNRHKLASLEDLPYRRHVHEETYKAIHPEKINQPINTEDLIGEELTSAVFTRGDGRDSLLSVQAIIVYKDNGEYKTFMYRRGKGVAIYKDHMQIVPAGGFELYERSRDAYNIDSIKTGFDPAYALYREVLEELFGMEEFDGNSKDMEYASVRDKVYEQQPIQMLAHKDYNNGKYRDCRYFKLSCNTTDVIYLRHVLSYVIVFDHEDFYKEFANQKLMLNRHEFVSKCECNIKALSNIFQEHSAALPDTAALVRHFLDSDIKKAIDMCRDDSECTNIKQALESISNKANRTS